MDEIRTDVDRLIHALQSAPGQQQTINQLAGQLNLSPAQVKKWVGILESEKRVKLKYSFNNVHVNWVPGSAAPKDKNPTRLETPADGRASRKNGHYAASAPDIPPFEAPERLSEQERADEQKQLSDSSSGGSYYSIGLGKLSTRHTQAQAPISIETLADIAREAEERYHRELEQKERLRARQAQERQGGRQKESPDAQSADAQTSQKESPEPEAEAETQADERAENKALPKEPDESEMKESEFASLALIASEPVAPASGRRKTDGAYSGEMTTTDETAATGDGRTAEPASSLPMPLAPMPSRMRPIRTPARRAYSLARAASAAMEPVSFSSSVQLPPMPKSDPEAMRFNEKLQAAMARIKQKADELDKLKERKRQLLREVYRPMERKMEAGADAIAEALLKYENRLLKLRERASQLPTEVADLDERQAQMARVAVEMQRVYDETAHLLTESLTVILESREKAATQLSVVRDGVGAQEAQVGIMRHSLDELSVLQAEVEARIAEAHAALQDEQANLNRAQEMFSQLSGLKAETEGQMQTAAGELKAQKRALHEMDVHLSRIDQVQNWVQQNRGEYDKRMRQLAEYIHSADEEYAVLRESVETGFVRRHLKELRALSESFEFELSQANTMEENVDEQIAQTRGQMGSLIAQAKRIAYLQEMQLEEDRGGRQDAAHRALGREAMFASMSGRDRERTRIRSMIAQVIEGKPAQKTENRKSVRSLSVRATPSRAPPSRASSSSSVRASASRNSRAFGKAKSKSKKR